MKTPIRLPDYEVLRQIGQGGFGVVYIARSRTDTLRAIKVVQCDHEGYEREVNAIRQYEHLRHNHGGLLRILHVGMGDGFYYYVMPLADSIDPSEPIDVENYKAKTLSAVMDRSRSLPLRQCVETIIQLLEGVEVLHKAGMVHRDIKPANILYFDGLPVLGDMGLLTQAGPDVSHCGTRGYEAPEGPGHPLADLYAVGMLLYHLSTGMRPADFPNLPSATMREDNEIKFSQVNKIILRACEKDPSRRYPNARAMSDALREVLSPSANAVSRVSDRATNVRAKPTQVKDQPKSEPLVIRSKRELQLKVMEVLNEAVTKARLHYDMNNQWLTPAEMAKVGDSVKGLFRKMMGYIPLDITSSCLLAEAIVETDARRKRELLHEAFTVHDVEKPKKGTTWFPGWADFGKIDVFLGAIKYTYKDADTATKVALENFTDSLTIAIEDNWEEYREALLDHSGQAF